ncbi:hypothetical protein [Pseudomonas sp. BN102]|uniref:hypothetical protein n=1 Tax=Pseudomonas sp. BN102 TaxID=2567886 RepID=UPI002453A7F4|nr:hypothetical protein [Pseudomonas sp. BN102]
MLRLAELGQRGVQPLAQLLLLLPCGLRLRGHRPALLPGAIDLTVSTILHAAHIGGRGVALLRQLALSSL